MKLITIILSLLILSSCDEREGLSPVGEILTGKHELRKFKVINEEGYRVHGSYFLFSGRVSGSTYSETKVSFSFKLPDSTYAMAEIGFGDIRVKIDSSIEKPYVTFHWESGYNANNMRLVMSYYVNYMVVNCRKEDFPYEVNINEL